MSVHIWDSDLRTVYLGGGGWPDQEITRDEALRLGSYLAHHYIRDVLDHSENVEGGSPISVVYYRSSWPDPELVEWHLERYGSVPFNVFTPIEERDGVRIRTVYEVDSMGRLAGRSEHVLDSRGELLSETRMTAEGKPLGRLEYTYNDAGDLVLTQEYGPDGELYDEIPSELE